MGFPIHVEKIVDQMLKCFGLGTVRASLTFTSGLYI